MKDSNRHLCICSTEAEKIKQSLSPNNSLKKENKKGKKYNNKKVEANGVIYDSEKEYKRHCELLLLQQAGKISNLERQVSFTLINKSEYGREIRYVADFTYKDKDGNLIVEDVKSKPTKTGLYSLKKRLLAERYGIKIQEYF